MEIDQVSPSKTQYTFKSKQLYLNSRGNNLLQGNWKRKFVAEIKEKTKKDRFQKLMQQRNVVCFLERIIIIIRELSNVFHFIFPVLSSVSLFISKPRAFLFVDLFC